jgi:hypothetical protein
LVRADVDIAAPYVREKVRLARLPVEFDQTASRLGDLHEFSRSRRLLQSLRSASRRRIWCAPDVDHGMPLPRERDLRVIRVNPNQCGN